MFIPYFTHLYGLKFTAIASMNRIYEIQTMLNNVSDLALLNQLRYELVYLVYSLTSITSSRRAHTIDEKLRANSIPVGKIPNPYSIESLLGMTPL